MARRARDRVYGGERSEREGGGGGEREEGGRGRGLEGGGKQVKEFMSVRVRLREERESGRGREREGESSERSRRESGCRAASLLRSRGGDSAYRVQGAQSPPSTAPLF